MSTSDLVVKSIRQFFDGNDDLIEAAASWPDVILRRFTAHLGYSYNSSIFMDSLRELLKATCTPKVEALPIAGDSSVTYLLIHPGKHVSLKWFDDIGHLTFDCDHNVIGFFSFLSERYRELYRDDKLLRVDKAKFLTLSDCNVSTDIKSRRRSESEVTHIPNKMYSVNVLIDYKQTRRSGNQTFNGVVRYEAADQLAANKAIHIAIKEGELLPADTSHIAWGEGYNHEDLTKDGWEEVLGSFRVA